LEELREGLIRFGSMITAKDLNLLFKSIDREATGTISISNMEDMLVQTRNAVKADSESMWEGYVDCT
jgi:Ca2+-binding EF-hand superfamily protein